jgi:predicted RNase H-like HicB family nuclease
MMRKRKYDAHFLHRGKWWVAWTEDVPGALTQGRTLDEARENLKDAIALMLEPVDAAALPASSSQLLHETVEL